VGGSFLVGPALFGVGVPMNFVVGTDLAHIVGKSIVAARKHRTLGNIDLKLGGIMVIGTIAGVEAGAQVIQQLKRTAHIDAVVGISFIVILLAISTFMGWESWKTLQMRRAEKKASPHAKKTPPREDHSAFSHIAKKNPKFRFPASYQPAGIGHRAHLDLVDHPGCVCRWIFQRIPWRWSGLHSHAFHDLFAGHTHPYRRRHGSF